MTGPRTIHVRINDASTAQPTAVRVRFSTADGRYLAPLGRLTDFATDPYRDVGGNLRLGKQCFAYIDGTCELQVPGGRLFVEASKGPEHVPLRHEVPLGIGQLTVRLSLERWCDWRKDGWYAGDGRGHALTPHGALLEAAAEDLAVVNLLAEERHPVGGPAEVPNILAFSGQRPALERPGHLVAVNTLNQHRSAGRLALLHCHRVVYPLRAESEDWALADWCDQCHRKAGLVVLASPWRAEGQAVANLRDGRIDALEICDLDPGVDSPTLAEWYRLLNAGLRVPLLGSSGKDSNAVALGAVRTYARTQPGESFSYGAWIEAVRAGRTFVTNGPLLRFTVNDHGPGARLQGNAPLRVMASVHCRTAVERIELVMNGELVSQSSEMLEHEFQPTTSCWLAVRSSGRGPDGRQAFAHTAPVYVER